MSNTSLQQQYDSKMATIQAKFKKIVQNYAKVTTDLSRKNSIIEELTERVADLEKQLGWANTKIVSLEGELRKANSVKSVYLDKYSARHTLTNLESAPIDERFKPVSPRLNIHYGVRQEREPSIQQDRFEQARNSLKAQVQRIVTTEDYSSSTKTPQPRPSVASAHPESYPSETLMRNKSAGSLMVGPQANAQTLQEIWQERDKEITRMDELFENLNHRLKDYE